MRWPAAAALVLALGACSAEVPTLGPLDSVELTITVRSEPGAPATPATLACDGSAQGTGRLADPQAAGAACEAATKNQALLYGPASTDRICTEIYGGPDRATVIGTIDGRAVNRSFDRANGCGIADWDALEPLLGRPSGSSEPVDPPGTGGYPGS